MATRMVETLLESGLLQFGRFQNGDEFVPFRFSLDYLPAYPEVLKILVTIAAYHVSAEAVDRLIAGPDAQPFGVALSLQTGMSLVYSRGMGEDAVYDLVGAYNSGDTGLLLANVYGNFQGFITLVQNAKRVGLVVQGILALVDLGIEKPADELRIYSLIRLDELVNEAVEKNLLPRGQAQATLAWIEGQAAILHRDAVSP